MRLVIRNERDKMLALYAQGVPEQAALDILDATQGSGLVVQCSQRVCEILRTKRRGLRQKRSYMWRPPRLR